MALFATFCNNGKHLRGDGVHSEVESMEPPPKIGEALTNRENLCRRKRYSISTCVELRPAQIQDFSQVRSVALDMILYPETLLVEMKGFQFLGNPRLSSITDILCCMVLFFGCSSGARGRRGKCV